ncbi:glucose 1-dehydrogenase [Polymorphobacter arshaanensis]|uniref:Glucose 1-dehydrogenase n=1 Tax=Glacieibacterium arshaanense TaxID=2511025 RepID=A0A4Y9EQ61_9SPHN|nr:glucose 1-dehydrogenase [Polymorphobacter arshaanensis]TFU05500.1 glucose 1-dehydrogenase [Polymorphobacter arshaanensis]
MDRLDGKVAIVTGAAAGIGEATARRFAAEGASVLLTDISEEGEAVAASIGAKAVFAQQDVTDEARWEEIIALALATWGRLDILVNNAGISMFGVVTNLSFAQWKRCISVDLDSVFLGTRAAIPAMRQSGGGSIINMSSMAGITGQRTLSAYCAAKGGVRFFSKAVALDCADAGDNIRVNSVHPGIIDTPIFRATTDDQRRSPVGPEPLSPDLLAGMVTPMKRAGRAEDIAAACAYLASDDAAFVTGTELIVDGGSCAA